MFSPCAPQMSLAARIRPWFPAVVLGNWDQTRSAVPGDVTSVRSSSSAAALFVFLAQIRFRLDLSVFIHGCQNVANCSAGIVSFFGWRRRNSEEMRCAFQLRQLRSLVSEIFALHGRSVQVEGCSCRSVKGAGRGLGLSSFWTKSPFAFPFWIQSRDCSLEERFIARQPLQRESVCGAALTTLLTRYRQTLSTFRVTGRPRATNSLLFYVSRRPPDRPTDGA